MHDQVEALRSKQFFHGGAVANIQRRVGKTLCCAPQPFQVPQRVACQAKEFAAHVVVYTGHLMALAVKMFYGFRTDQTAASGNEYLHVANLFSRPSLMRRVGSLYASENSSSLRFS